MRIVSTVPSQTEPLFDLGLYNEVVGITKFCIHPRHWFKSKTRIGGTKNLKLEVIRSLNPDLIIANKEENNKDQIEILSKDFQTFVSDIKTLDDNLKLIKTIGDLTKTSLRANLIIDKFKTLKTPSVNTTLSCLYLIWKNPYMSIGKDTFIHEMLSNLGFRNVCDNELRYPEIKVEQIKHINPDIIMLSSEPFPFKQKDIEALKEQIPSSKIVLVDGEAFSWYGTRVIKKWPYLMDLQNRLTAIQINELK